MLEQVGVEGRKDVSFEADLRFSIRPDRAVREELAAVTAGIKKDRVVGLGDLQGELNIQTSPVTISITKSLRKVK